MKSLRYLIVAAAVALAITPTLAVGQTVYDTGTQGCCDLLDSHYTLIAAPQGVPLGDVYSSSLCNCWALPLNGSWWINPAGGFVDEPIGNYTFRQTFTLANSAGAMLAGGFAADDNACVTLNGGPAQCTPGGEGGYEQYTPFEFSSGFQTGTNTLDFVVNNVTAAIALEVAVSNEKKLFSFGHGTDGTSPQAALISDAAGNLYGTTYDGGIHDAGTVFELTPLEGGGWSEKVLHSFNYNSTDGAGPRAGLIFDAAGNLYGTTTWGGIHIVGTVFELKPNGDGNWTELVLHSFGAGADGQNSTASLIQDAAGNLYGTTVNGGIHGAGTLFELTPRVGGGWSEKTLHSFGRGTHGQHPYAAVIFDTAGNLYGTTYDGGIHNLGTVFELIPNADGGWTELVLRNFGNGADGQNPTASLIGDAAGNLYGTTLNGGIHGLGTLFELAPRVGGGWSEKTLHSFGQGTDGQHPYAGLILDTVGNFYGATYAGGIHNLGTVFGLSPSPEGGWIPEVLHSFGNGADGQNPGGSLIWDAAGNLYGTTSAGGNYPCGSDGCGTVFEITP